jgi:hypothetical protein
MDPNDWEKGDLVTANDYQYYIEIYHKEISFILEYDAVRRDYVNGNISKEQFLDNVTLIKEKLRMIR